ncbi:MAG TPA: AraC family transcriptional regulator [Candidatus Cybelea sp.]|nr:AraC family transcriptional regulator [Candidatus Cybelea sp.]
MVSRSLYLPSCRLGTHAHHEDRVILTTRGRFDSVYAGRAFRLDARRTIFRPAHVEHRDHYACETACVTIRLPAHELSAPRAFDFSDDDLPGVARRLWTELGTCDRAAELAIESLSAEILGRLWARPVRDGLRARWLTRMRDRLEAEFADPPSLRALARDACRNASHVATAFRRTYGKSPGEFVRDVKIWRARALLDDGSVPLAVVAARAGFADQSHFARLFKRRFSMTPGQYRRRGSR